MRLEGLQLIPQKPNVSKFQRVSCRKSEVFNVTKTNYLNVAKSEVFNVAKTNYLNVAKSEEPVISAKPKFLALTHVLVYGYWCCQVTILSAYNASVMFLLRYYQSIAML